MSKEDMTKELLDNVSSYDIDVAIQMEDELKKAFKKTRLYQQLSDQIDFSFNIYRPKGRNGDFVCRLVDVSKDRESNEPLTLPGDRRPWVSTGFDLDEAYGMMLARIQDELLAQALESTQTTPNTAHLFETMLEGRILPSEAQLERYAKLTESDDTIVYEPFDVLFIKDGGEADGMREHTVSIDDQQSFSSALRQIHKAVQLYGEPDYFVVASDQFESLNDYGDESMPLPTIKDVYNFLLGSQYIRKS